MNWLAEKSTITDKIFQTLNLLILIRALSAENPAPRKKFLDSSGYCLNSVRKSYANITLYSDSVSLFTCNRQFIKGRTRLDNLVLYYSYYLDLKLKVLPHYKNQMEV